MKLRIRGDSIRLRVTQAEVRGLGDGGRVEDALSFAVGGRFAYALVVVPDGPAPLAAVLTTSPEGARVEVRIARAAADRWTSSDEVGVEGAQALDDGRSLRILVEKDFACLKVRPGEDDADAFPHPA